MLNQHFIALVVTAITHFVLAGFVLFSGPKKQTNIFYSLYSTAISVWSLGQAFSMSTSDPDLALRFWRLNHYGVIFIPIFFTHFVISLERSDGTISTKNKFILGFIYMAGLVFSVLNAFGLLIEAVQSKFYFKNFIEPTTPYYLFFNSWMACACVGLYKLFSTLIRAQSSKRNQLMYFSISMLVAYIGGVPNFLPTFNVLIPIWVPFGTYAISIYAFFTAYAILAHNLMDIEVVIRRTAVFAGLFAFVYGTFTFATIASQELFKNILGWNEWFSIVPTALIITLSLRPLEIFLTNITEKFLFQKKYDYRQLLRTFADETLTILDLQKLMDQTVLQLTKIVKLESACLMLHQKEEKSYTIVAAAGFKEKDIVFRDDDILIQYLRDGHRPILKDKASEQIEGDGRLKNDFKRIKAQLCLPIMLHDELIGVLALGMKKSGEDYTPEDIDILSTLARTEAIAISNAQLFDELSKTQAEAAQREKMAVIGTLAAGINHEICNPLGIVRGQCEMFLLNMRDGLYKEKTPEQLIQISSDIMSKVIKETDRATAITKKLSSFAKPSKKNEAEEVSVAGEIDEILALLGHDLKLSNIEFHLNLPAGFPEIYVDRKQFQEILFNIIRNAAQAMDKKQGCIAVDGSIENGFAAVRISDNGMGIPKEKINQIFNPFYTTKAPGKGTGLGLFIVKQVVERNKGTIEVDSVEGEGTTFVLRFPCAAKLAAA